MHIEECDLGALNSDEDHDRDHACSSECRVRDLWQCTDNNCELLCGNGKLDPNEQCDYLSQPHKGMSIQGYFDRNESWDTDPATNVMINIGCSDHCTIKEGFICPAHDQPSLLCSDTCHDGIYEGPHI